MLRARNVSLRGENAMRWKRFVVAVVAAASLGVVGTTTSTVGPAAAQGAGSPFDSPSVFCTKTTAPPGARNASSPGVGRDSITIADFSTDVSALRRLGVNLEDYHQMYQTFWGEVN